LVSVGKILQSEREAQRRTLKEVSDTLNIREVYLSAVENEEFNRIPGEVFVKGFIRNYANFLGLDGDALVKEYKSGVFSAECKPSTRAIDKKQIKKPRVIVREKQKHKLLQKLTIIAGVILFLLLCIWLIF